VPVGDMGHEHHIVSLEFASPGSRGQGFAVTPERTAALSPCEEVALIVRSIHRVDHSQHRLSVS
jgi:hypothetical protein